MPKSGRNDPSPCGSGKKYKHCCLAKDQAAELAPAIAQRVALQAQKAKQAAQQQNDQAELLQSLSTLREALALEAASNAVIGLVDAGRLDEAEQAAASSWRATPRFTMATIGSAWSTKRVASSARPPTATAR